MENTTKFEQGTRPRAPVSDVTIHRIVQYVLIGAIVITLAAALPPLIHGASTLQNQQKTIDDDVATIHEEINGISRLVNEQGLKLQSHSTALQSITHTTMQHSPDQVTVPSDGSRAQVLYRVRNHTTYTDIKWELPLVVTGTILIDLSESGDAQVKTRVATLPFCHAQLVINDSKPSLEFDITIGCPDLKSTNGEQEALCRQVKALTLEEVHSTALDSKYMAVMPNSNIRAVTWANTTDTARQHIYTLSLDEVDVYQVAGGVIVRHRITSTHCEITRVMLTKNPC